MASKKQKKKAEHASDDIYDNEEVEEELMENDEIDPKEAGFMEGYNEKQEPKKRKLKRMLNDDSNEDD